MATLERAVMLAAERHAGQVDKAGAPYLLHPLRVMLSPLLTGREEQMAAVLHDVVEDTETTLEELGALGFSEGVVGMVQTVTKQPGEEGNYDAFIARVLAGPTGALRVKRADIADNLDLSRIAAPTTKDHARIERYRAADALLRAELARRDAV